ncbi:MAG: hypothetical protein ACEQSX_19440, partial [Baekduiaceae bacterium]
MPPLTIAVPRGALMRDTLDLLDRLGVDTAEVRANDRKLLFADIGIVIDARVVDHLLDMHQFTQRDGSPGVAIDLQAFHAIQAGP